MGMAKNGEGQGFPFHAIMPNNRHSLWGVQLIIPNEGVQPLLYMFSTAPLPPPDKNLNPPQLSSYQAKKFHPPVNICFEIFKFSRCPLL